VIDALEGRDVAVIDVPGAFMQADMDELVHVRFTGKMVDLLLEIGRNMYGPCVVKEGKETLSICRWSWQRTTLARFCGGWMHPMLFTLI
jgi:hypothetical protein